MFAATLALAAVLYSDPAPRPADDLAAYREARARAGRSAEAQVALALWCEARGLSAERIEHLTLAIAADPTNVVARALLGLVRDGDRWRRPEDLGGDEKTAEAFALYAERRKATPPTASAQWKLASWCDKNGLPTQAEAHAAAVLKIEPNHAAARKRLGFRSVKGRWVTDEQLADEAKEARLQQAADRKWRPRLAQWRSDLKDQGRRGPAEAALAGVTDPRAVPSIVRTFSTDDPEDQRRLVQLLGQVDGVRASRLLVTVALSAASPESRRLAIETLVRRDPRDFVGEVIEQIRDLIKYQVQPVDGPGSTGVLLVEGETYRTRRRYQSPALPALTLQMMEQRMAGIWAPLPREDIPFRMADGRTVGRLMGLVTSDRNADDATRNRVMSEMRRDVRIAHDVAQAQGAAAAAREQMVADISRIEAENREAREVNDRVMTILTGSTGADVGLDRDAWRRWWTDRRGYAYVSPPRLPKPTFDQEVPLDFQPSYAMPLASSSCFVAGTPVTTRTGPRPIEELQVGDEVLSQDVTSGRLAFEPVVSVYHNPPSSTLAIRLGDDAVVATGIHRFWIAGKGWTMARDLKVGDLVRTVGGVARVEAIEPRPAQPVFNLDVARARSFFVGKAGALVHDHSLVEPTPEPFDAPMARRD